ncbi:2-oxoglutarate dehydrogenase E1 component [bacterium]|nr:2-oxoglutarate dehydrogenase E1 component [bacterium]
MSSEPGQGEAINSWNPEYMEALYNQWRQDPQSVTEEWRAFFQGFELGQSFAVEAPQESGASADEIEESAVERLHTHEELTQFEWLQAQVDSLIYHYRDVGHLIAQLDPLGRNRESHALLELAAFGLDESHLDMQFHADKLLWGPPRMTLREILAALRETYCRSIGAEYMHIQNTPERRWLQRRMEKDQNHPQLPVGKKLRIARLLRKATAFERFLHTNYVGQKRFSLEGGETLIPLLDAIVEKAPYEGLQEIVLGMAHRGRLNVLTNILQKSYEEIFTEFEDNYTPGMVMGDGDVKYHKGYSLDWYTYQGQKVHLSLTANPSHLEAVYPVVEGRARAKQRILGDFERTKVMPLLIHGDAAFPGQGIVAETLNLSQLVGYRTGGSIHIIVNNQIGFTTLPEDARSMAYCTDVAKSIQAPIFHVNADDPEAVIHIAEIAVEFRQKFQKDVVIDLYCYRRLGHNEGDEPSFTQPKLYEMINSHQTTQEIYMEKLIADGVATREMLDEMSQELDKYLSDAQGRAKNQQVVFAQQSLRDEWKDMQPIYTHDAVETGVPRERLVEVAEIWDRFPDGFEPNRKIRRLFGKRVEAVRNNEPLDWATAESLAFGSLLIEGTPLRLSGQDSRRGTFSQRHAAVWDSSSGEMYIPLNNIAAEQGRFCVYDSPLSEAAVLGFDYGYSLGNPDMMILWEAQFGDFANGGQTIIDQFIVSSESKWGRFSGLTMLLPHGYEGQGPEHSSAWLERFLQMCAQDNIQVCNISTPAQYFHALRRQMRRNFRKPLIIMAPKSLLRHPRATSRIDDMAEGHFREVLDDDRDPKKVQRIVMCSGKVYYDLLEYREQENIDDVAIVRVEQFYPFAENGLAAMMDRYRKKVEFVWCQEEPKNRGGWTFMSQRMQEHFDIRLRYVGRSSAASPATGSLHRHRQEQDEIVRTAMQMSKKALATSAK